MTYLTVTATNGTKFRLLKTKMSSMHLGDTGYEHWAYRKDVRASFVDGVELPTAGPYSEGQSPSKYWGDQAGWLVCKAGRSIAIGCMRFNGRDYLALRKWALSR